MAAATASPPPLLRDDEPACELDLDDGPDSRKARYWLRPFNGSDLDQTKTIRDPAHRFSKPDPFHATGNCHDVSSIPSFIPKIYLPYYKYN